MKKLLAIAMAFIFGFFLVPLTTGVQWAQAAGTPPPVAPALVREGDFAIELATELKLGTTEDEAEAEAMLTSPGIAPRNGWISDYPVTPDVIAEIQQAITDAADANRLPMTRDDALKALQNVEASFDLAVVPDTSAAYTESQSPTETQYTEPEGVNNYYYEEGPPVVTYYPPPPDYGYLYAWVPSPFWCGAFFFPGFFVLHDFDIVVVADHHHFHHHHHGRGVVTNHFFDPKTRRVARIDPVTRTVNRGHVDTSLHGRSTTSEGRRGAAAINDRSMERARTRSPGSPAVSGRTGLGNSIPSKIGPQFRSPSGRNMGHVSTSGERAFSGSQMGPRSFSIPAPSRAFSSSHFGRGGSFGGFRGGPIAGFQGMRGARR